MQDSTTTPCSGAQAIVNALIEQGVDTVFGYPGGAVLPLYDALYERRDAICHYLTAHEQGAAHAADGYARATGRVGVVLATSGPGSTNLVTGIAAAFMDSVPLVAITGNVSSTFIGKDSFQEVYTTGITLPITKHNFFVQDARRLPAVLREAFAIATSGRPGPVLVDVTKDAQVSPCEWEQELGTSAGGVSDATADAAGASGAAGVGGAAWASAGGAAGGAGGVSDAVGAARADDIDNILAAIAAHKRPLILFGGGVISANASEELRALIATLQLPAAHSIMGIGTLDVDDALNLGLVGMHGRLSGNRALAEADLILALGFRFSDRVVLDKKSWAPRADIIHIDIDPSELDKNIEATTTIVGDLRAILRALLARLGVDGNGAAARKGDAAARGTGAATRNGDANSGSEPTAAAAHDSPTWSERPNTTAWRAQIDGWRANDYRPTDSDSVLKPHQILESIAELAGSDAILTTDVGQHQMWAAQYCRGIRPRGFLTSGGLGAMGFGYGAAIGAQIGAGGGSTRERPVIHITGDGSFHMNLNEVCTAVSYGLPIISIIFNNRALGMVRQWQRSFYDAHYCATTLDRATDYVKVAEGFGAVGIRAATIAEFKAALTRALTISGPVWIECPIDRDEQVLPL
ncbi:MAG: hypothetical protein LBH64_04155, partial [Coriobacteriales bacterium]|nr:hypothetical protein [Coriobacteriales bacterium]